MLLISLKNLKNFWTFESFRFSNSKFFYPHETVENVLDSLFFVRSCCKFCDTTPWLSVTVIFVNTRKSQEATQMLSKFQVWNFHMPVSYNRGNQKYTYGGKQLTTFECQNTFWYKKSFCTGFPKVPKSSRQELVSFPVQVRYSQWWFSLSKQHFSPSLLVGKPLERGVEAWEHICTIALWH